MYVNTKMALLFPTTAFYMVWWKLFISDKFTLNISLFTISLLLLQQELV